MTKRARGTGSLLKRGNVWWIRYYVDGERHDESTKSKKKADAVKLLNKRLAEVADGRYQGPQADTLNFEDLASMVSDHYHGKRSPKRVAHALKRLRSYFGNYRVKNITADRLSSYLKARREQGMADGTIAYELGILRQAFKLAYRAEKVYRVPAFPKIKLDNARTGFFDEAEFEALRAELPDYLKNVFAFAYWTGWRVKSEVLTRQWRHVDFDAGVIRLEPGETKNGRGRTFPIDVLPELRDILAQQKAYTDKIEKQTGQIVPWLFHRNGRRIKEVQMAWWGACKRAGFAVPRKDAAGNAVRDKMGNPVMVPTKRPHDFRRTAVRRLERAGVSRSVAMQLVGHQTETMYQRYAITCEADLREGLQKVHVMHEKAGRKVLPFRTGTTTGTI